ncbi:MAG: hypothetical protein V4454_08475 [Pseudomonadota bacterium]
MNQLAHELANEIFMSSSYAAHLVVEGSSDYVVFKQHVIAANGINILPAHGGANLISCKASVEAMKVKSPQYATRKIHFFMDRDYQLVLGKVVISETLTTTDLRDMECQMVASDAFNAVVTEIACPKKMSAANMGAKELRLKLLACAETIGAIRFASAKHDRAIDFKELNASKFFDGKNLALSGEKLSAHLAGKNKHCTVTVNTIAQDVELCKKENYFENPLLLCSGHDIALLMSSAFKVWWKAKNFNGSLEIDTLESMLRLSYRDIFRSSVGYKKVHAWLLKVTSRSDLLAAPI